MIRMYHTDMETNVMQEVTDFRRGTWINLINPTENEIQYVCENIHIKEDFIKYPLDYEEKARIDIEEEDQTILFIIDVPVTEKGSNGYVYSTMPIGMIVVRDDYFITVSLKEVKIINNFEKGFVKGFCTYKKSRFILQLMYNNSSEYLNYLKKINKETENLNLINEELQELNTEMIDEISDSVNEEYMELYYLLLSENDGLQGEMDGEKR